MSFVTQFDASYERIFGTQVGFGDQADAFFGTFYQLLMDSSEAAKAAFQNTDMTKQKKMLRQSLIYMVSFGINGEPDAFIERLAQVHSRAEQDIAPELYDLWLEALINTVRKYDSRFNHEVELAWRMALAHGITYMKFKYDQYDITEASPKSQ